MSHTVAGVPLGRTHDLPPLTRPAPLRCQRLPQPPIAIPIAPPIPQHSPRQRIAGITRDKVHPHSREGGFSNWNCDATVFFSGAAPQRPPPKRYPRTVKAPLAQSVPACTADAAPVNAVALDVVDVAAEPAPGQVLWAGPGDFENEPVYQQWRQVLERGTKLRDKCRAWEKTAVYPVWLVPKERAGQPPRRDEIKVRQKQAVQAELAKEAAILEKRRLAKEAERKRQQALEAMAPAVLGTSRHNNAYFCSVFAVRQQSDLNILEIEFEAVGDGTKGLLLPDPMKSELRCIVQNKVVKTLKPTEHKYEKNDRKRFIKGVLRYSFSWGDCELVFTFGSGGYSPTTIRQEAEVEELASAREGIESVGGIESADQIG